MIQKPIKITLVSGSIRDGSITSFTTGHIADTLKSFGHEVNVLHLRKLSLPTFPGSYKEKIPDNVAFFRDQLQKSDLLVIATPEYHGSVSGALKNALDWIDEKYLAKKMAAIVCVMGGSVGGTSLDHLRVILTQLGVWVSPAQLIISSSSAVFDSDGNILDDVVKKRIDNFSRNLIADTQIFHQNHGLK